MSVLNHVVLQVDSNRNAKLEEALDNLEFGSGHRTGQRLNRLDTDRAGGLKHFCTLVYAACFNYVPTSEVKEMLEIIDWGYNTAIATIDHEDTEGVEVWSNKSARVR